MLVSGRAIGAIGEVDPQVLAAHDIEGRVGWFEVDLGALLGRAPPAGDLPRR